MHITESTRQLTDGTSFFDITLIEAEQSATTVIFAAGRGGSPIRHLDLMRLVARRGCTVVAPHFDMLPSTTPTQQDLEIRLRQLELVLSQYAPTNQPMAGIGHSIGAVMLLLLAGAKAHTFAGHEVTANAKWSFDRLALLAPAVDFFRHPEASVDVDARIHLRAGNRDTIVTPNRVLAFKNMLPDQSKIEFYLDEDAGHFSYMNELPPHVEDCQPNRKTFLSVLAEEVGAFVTQHAMLL